MNTYKLDVGKIINEEETEILFDVKVDFGEIDLRGQNVGIGEIGINGKAISADDGVMLSANANGSIILNCSRCLVKYDHSLNIEINEFYSIDDSEAEYKVDNDLIDISGAVIETLALQLDLKTLCKEDCAGLCPKCGINRNTKTCECKERTTDIRWNKLKELKNKFKSSKRSDQKNSKE